MAPSRQDKADESAIFCDAKAKVEWADKRIDELHTFLRRFLQERPPDLTVERDDEGGGYVVSLEADPLPRETALMLGDCVHNLRSALDLMYYELVGLCGGTPDGWTKFPFRDSRKNVKGILRQAHVEAASQEVVEVILDTVQPYDEGNDALYALHRLDIADKHHIVLPVVGVTQLTGVCFRDANNNVFRDMTATVDTGSGQLNLVRTTAEVEITDYGEPALGVFFGEGQPLEGQSIFPTLQQLSEVVSGTIENIADAYAASI